MFKTTFKLASRFLLLLLLLLVVGVGCASEEKSKSDPAPTPIDGDIPEVAGIILQSSSPNLPSASSVNITAFVYDQNGQVMEGVFATFAASNGGTLTAGNYTTDAGGVARAQLSTPYNKANRIITVSATAGLVTETIDIPVIGTTLAITGPTSAMLDSVATLEITVRDSAGTGISGLNLVDIPIDLTVVSLAGNPIAYPAAKTGSNGRATIEVSVDGWATVGGVDLDTITVSGMGATPASHSFNITTEYFVFIEPDPASESRPELDKNTPYDVTVLWTDGGVAVVGETVTFSTTRGGFVASDTFVDSAATDATGHATVQITSDSAGSATITAKSSTGLVAKIEILFVATVADSLTLQANPAIIGINESSEILAVVRDPDNNLVKNMDVHFAADDAIGGKVEPSPVTTDEFGQASTFYTAGNQTSGHEGVTIKAFVWDRPLSAKVPITVAGKQLFVTLGFSDVIEEDAGLRYRKKASVMVVDSAAHPVPGTNVTLSLWPTYYHKGFFYWGQVGSDKGWVQYVTASNCANEDSNRNGILDLGEDFNNNARLDPGGVATINDTSGPFTVTTGDTGFADFYIVYYKQFAWWAALEVTATVSVEGTEATDKARFVLPIAISDVKGETTLAGHYSPFGTSNQCDNNYQLTATPSNLSGSGPVTLTLTDIVAGGEVLVAGEPVTAAVYLAPDDPAVVPAFDVTASTGNTNVDGQFISNVVVTNGLSGDSAVIYYEAGGALAIVVVEIP